MEYVIYLDEVMGLVLVTASGDWVPAIDNNMIHEIMDVVETKKLSRVLLDISALHFDFPMIQIFERVRDVREFRLEHNQISSKVALVYSASNTKVEQDMQFFETVAQNRSLPYRIFTDVNDARKWLAAP
ncbi:MAG TPA: hypothetical protein PK078_00875 [Anaerolineales bacterium]|nr:hypothetical protein [Anaerolineales bacterium]